MEEKRINFETAKLAKEKGFDWPVEDGFYFRDRVKSDIHSSDYHHDFDNNTSYYISRPSQSLLQKWLREVHNIYLLVDMGFNRDYHWKYFDQESDFTYSAGIFETYEKALEAGLQKALKTLK